MSNNEHGQCPNCGSISYDGDSVEIEGDKASQNCACHQCDATWVDTYILSRRLLFTHVDDPHLMQASCVLSGDPVSGFCITGPFMGAHLATHWAEGFFHNSSDGWWIAPLANPED